MELVPFLERWAGSETKLDIKGIYRRPGQGINLTGPLPLRRHADWASKGFQFVSLASMSDLAEVHKELRAMGHDPLAMRASFTREGHFDVAQYIREEQKNDAAFLADLQAKVDKFGVETVVEMMRMADPTFQLPNGIVQPAPSAPDIAKAVGSATDTLTEAVAKGKGK